MLFFHHLFPPLYLNNGKHKGGGGGIWIQMAHAEHEIVKGIYKTSYGAMRRSDAPTGRWRLSSQDDDQNRPAQLISKNDSVDIHHTHTHSHYLQSVCTVQLRDLQPLALVMKPAVICRRCTEQDTQQVAACNDGSQGCAHS